ncbi:MAG TPA: hypothetical protein VLA24_17275 [Pseudomonadales bacterium]|nr:hypothetical protein [Pseudomonadales bacterium]
MKYTIISEKIGTVGEEFVPGAGTNIEALLTHGFIKVETPSDSPAPKSAKNKAQPKKD